MQVFPISSTPQVNIPEQMTQIPHNAMSLYTTDYGIMYTESTLSIRRYIFPYTRMRTEHVIKKYKI